MQVYINGDLPTVPTKLLEQHFGADWERIDPEAIEFVTPDGQTWCWDWTNKARTRGRWLRSLPEPEPPERTAESIALRYKTIKALADRSGADLARLESEERGEVETLKALERLRADDAPADAARVKTLAVRADVLNRVRAALRDLPKGGKFTKASAIIRAAHVNEAEGRAALRHLEGLGEYSGFCKPAPGMD